MQEMLFYSSKAILYAKKEVFQMNEILVIIGSNLVLSV